MKAKDRNSYVNRACRELMGARRDIEQGKAEGGIVGLMKKRMGESSLEALRMVYGQPSLWDLAWPRKSASQVRQQA